MEVIKSFLKIHTSEISCHSEIFLPLAINNRESKARTQKRHQIEIELKVSFQKRKVVSVKFTPSCDTAGEVTVCGLASA